MRPPRGGLRLCAPSPRPRALYGSSRFSMVTTILYKVGLRSPRAAPPGSTQTHLSILRQKAPGARQLPSGPTAGRGQTAAARERAAPHGATRRVSPLTVESVVEGLHVFAAGQCRTPTGLSRQRFSALRATRTALCRRCNSRNSHVDGREARRTHWVPRDSDPAGTALAASSVETRPPSLTPSALISAALITNSRLAPLVQLVPGEGLLARDEDKQSHRRAAAALVS